MTKTPAGHDILDQVAHWLRTPANAYLGSSYGNDLKAVIATPFAAGLADEQLAKLQADVPVLDVLPVGSVNLYSVNTPPDRSDIVIEVAGRAVRLGGGHAD